MTPFPDPALSTAQVRAGALDQRIMQDVCGTLELGGATAGLQHDLLLGPVHDVVDRVSDLRERSDRVPSLWSTDIGKLLDQAQRNLSSPDQGSQALGQANLAAVRGMTAGTSHYVLDTVYQDGWRSQIEPLASPVQSADTGDALAQLRALAQQGAQIAATLPTLSAPAIPPFDAPQRDPFKSFVDQALESCRVAHAAWAGEGLQPTLTSTVWLPSPPQDLQLTVGGGKAPAIDGPKAIVQKVLAAARSQLGVRYQCVPQWKPFDHLDCSSLVLYSYRQAHISLPRMSHQQWLGQYGHKITRDQMQPGDAIYFNNHGAGPQPGHVVLYAGNNRVIAASSSAGKVVYQDLPSLEKSLTFMGAKRFYGGR